MTGFDETDTPRDSDSAPDPESPATRAAERMNDPDGAHPGVAAHAPEPHDDDELPELMG
jgi:hypothetical protein